MTWKYPYPNRLGEQLSGRVYLWERGPPRTIPREPLKGISRLGDHRSSISQWGGRIFATSAAQPANISAFATLMVSRNRLSRKRSSGIFRSKRLMSLPRPMVSEFKRKRLGRSLFDGRAGRQLSGLVTWFCSLSPRVSLKDSRKNIGRTMRRNEARKSFARILGWF